MLDPSVECRGKESKKNRRHNRRKTAGEENSRSGGTWVGGRRGKKHPRYARCGGTHSKCRCPTKIHMHHHHCSFRLFRSPAYTTEKQIGQSFAFSCFFYLASHCAAVRPSKLEDILSQSLSRSPSPRLALASTSSASFSSSCEGQINHVKQNHVGV